MTNTIIGSGGPSAYAFLSDACLAELPSETDLPRHREHEWFGETSGGVHDLATVAEQRREEQRVRLGEADADVETGYEVAAPPSVVWQYLVNPEKRIRLFRGFETGITSGAEASTAAELYTGDLPPSEPYDE